jgi:hypothetical protein
MQDICTYTGLPEPSSCCPEKAEEKHLPPEVLGGEKLRTDTGPGPLRRLRKALAIRSGAVSVINRTYLPGSSESGRRYQH